MESKMLVLHAADLCLISGTTSISQYPDKGDPRA